MRCGSTGLKIAHSVANVSADAGFSSFIYLKKMDVDGLKIDGKFISNMSQDEANQLVVEAMVGVAGQMGKITVAEFVDEPETLEILARMGVDYAQGFLLDMPSAIHSLADLELKRLWRAERKEPNQTVLTQP